MKGKMIYVSNFFMQICWMTLFFTVLLYVKNQNTFNLESNGEHSTENVYKIDTVYVPPCEHPAYMSGRDTDTSHVTKFISVGRKICMSVFIKNVNTNTQKFIQDTCCRDSLIYSFPSRSLTKYECVRLVHSLYDCKDSLLSKKVIIFYNKDFVQSDLY
jgi:hypothetical protein